MEYKPVGEGLLRPHGVAVARDGRVFASDDGAAVSLIRPDGALKRIGAPAGRVTAMAFDKRGGLALARTRNGQGALERYDVTAAAAKTLLTHIEDKPFAAIHALAYGADGTLFGVVSSSETLAQSYAKGTDPDAALFTLPPGGTARIVKRGLQFALGCTLDSRQRELYLTQTRIGEVVRFEMRPDGGIAEARPFGAQLGYVPSEMPTAELTAKQRSRLGLPGGCAFDAEGNLWVTLPFANKIVAVTPSHSITVISDDPDGRVLRMPTQIAFGGNDFQDLYVASPERPHLLKARSPVPGQPLAHQR